MVELPYDVWIRIAQFLPRETLISLPDLLGKNVNEALRDEAKKAKYQVLCVERKALKMSDQDSPRLVRSIVMSEPWQIPSESPARSRLERICHKIRQRLDPGYFINQEEHRTRRLLQADLKSVTEMVKEFNNATEYHFTCNAFHPFLLPILRILKDRLVILVMKVSLEILDADIAGVDLPKLQFLGIHLETGEYRTEDINQRLDSLLVFINNLRDTLRSLSISCTSSSRFLRLQYLFQRLEDFPHLHGISLCIPFDGGHLTPINDFERFVKNHRSTLQCLELKTASCTVNVPSQAWIMDILSHMYQLPFPCLRELTIALRPLKADLSIFYHFLSANAPTLDTIKLTDRLLRFEDVEAILIRLTRSRLQRLCLTVQFLTPKLLNLLAIRTPHTVFLGLAFDGISPDEGYLSVSDKWQKNEVSQFSDALINHPALQCWGLQHIALRGRSAHIPAEYWLRNMESKLVESIPALRCVSEYSA
ncbi:hypothetical protein BDQ17DRAFT_1364912 [Cyathus striatus]|nr:hypothetical protein BDQ17DRAFT_1364912 [Cyathus striatus]